MGYGHNGELYFGYQGRIRGLDSDELEEHLSNYNTSSSLQIISLWTEWEQNFEYVLYAISYSNEMINARRFGYSFPSGISLPTEASDIENFAQELKDARTELEKFYNWLVEQNIGEDDDQGIPEPQWILTSTYG